MMYGASWMDRCAASSWISERALSGRQISGGGSSPNSSRITSARDVISQHSMGGVWIFWTENSETQICAARAVQSSTIGALRSRTDNGPGGRVGYADGTDLRRFGVDGGCSPVGRRARVVDRYDNNVGRWLKPLCDASSREVTPPVIGRVELLVQRKVSEVCFHGCDIRRFLNAHELGDCNCGDDPDHYDYHYQLEKCEAS